MSPCTLAKKVTCDQAERLSDRQHCCNERGKHGHLEISARIYHNSGFAKTSDEAVGHSARLHTVGADHLELGVDEGFLMRKHELALLAIRLQHSHAESLSDLSSDVVRGLVNSVSI